MISKETVAKVQQVMDIAEVVGEFVTLKKKGKDLSACCPFHNEKTPSFYVSPTKGIYKCFGCGKAGDSITFIMEHEKLDFSESIRFLAKKYHIEVEETISPNQEDFQGQGKRDAVLIALNWAKNWFIDQLRNSDEGQSFGLSYFKERGFTEPTLKDFENGYSPNQRDALFKAAINNGFSQEILSDAGLISVKDDGSVSDRFRGRAIFPILNVVGKPIAFGARTLSKDKNQPKYLNSPETLVYNKSQILYGLFQAKNAIRINDRCYLTEGYTDVMALHQAGIQNVVASSGTSLTEEQIKLIQRYTKKISVLYDGDAAGIKASLRGIDMLIQAGLEVKAVILPDGEDPDSYLKKYGSSALQDFLSKEEKDFVSFKFGLFAQEMQTDPFKRSEVMHEIVQSIIKVPDVFSRTVFFKKASQLLEVDENLLITEGNKLLQHQANKDTIALLARQKVETALAEPTSVTQDKIEWVKTNLYLKERESIKVLVMFGQEALKNEDFLLAQVFFRETEDVKFSTPIFSQIADTYRQELLKGHFPTPEWFRANTDRPIAEKVMEFEIERFTPSENWEKKGIYITPEKEKLNDVFWNKIEMFKWSVAQTEIILILKELKVATDPSEIQRLTEEFLFYKSIEVELAKKMGVVISGLTSVS